MVQKMNKKKKSTIKDIEGLEKELRGFKNWLPTQINKTLYQKYRVKKPLKPSYCKWIIKKVKTILKTHLGKLPSQLTKEDIEKWEEYCYSTYLNNGNIARFQAMNKLLTYLGHNDWKLKLPPVERRIYDTMTEEEREGFLGAISNRCEGILGKTYSQLKPKEMKNIMDKAIVMIQTITVSRPLEVCDIEIRNIDFERHKIKLRDSKTHEMIIRMGMEDALLMTPAVENAIKDWLKIRKRFDSKKPEDNKYLFIYPYGKYKGEKINYNKLLNLCKEIGIEAKIKTIRTTPYCLKRTEITRDCDRTNNLRIPQLRARHTDFNSTMRYNQKTTSDAVDYLQSDKYDDINLTHETKIKKLAERALKGEIPLEVWQQLRSDLQIGNPEIKKKTDLIGYS